MTVTIAMATRNGAAHLQAQLDSLLAQTDADWRLWVSDDCSADATTEILLAFRLAHPHREIRVLTGPGRGAAANFLSLLCHPDLPPGPVALCDQDDVWLKGKLARALRRIARAPEGPVLYAAESWRTDARLRRLARRSAPALRPGFANAMVQNLCSGHTTVLNAQALALVRLAGQPAIAFHDWWLYQLVTGAGGTCRLDPQPVALYRQHHTNLIGATGGLGPMIRRADLLLHRDYALWLSAHHSALRQTGLLTPQAMALLAPLIASETQPGLARAKTMRRLGLHRSTPFGTAALWCAAALGRA